jgi:hypothetical protein
MSRGNKPDPERQQTGRIGGLTSWKQTEDRDGRMARPRDNSPASDGYHAKQLGLDPAGPWTREAQARISTAKKLYFARLRSASAKAIKAKKAEKLRALAAKLEAEAGA